MRKRLSELPLQSESVVVRGKHVQLVQRGHQRNHGGLEPYRRDQERPGIEQGFDRPFASEEAFFFSE